MLNIDGYKDPIRRLFKLYIANARITLTEKLTRLLTGIVIALVCALFFIIALTFVSFGVLGTLKQSLPDVAAYAIIGGFYVLLILIMMVFKRTLLLNPIARFLSKIIIEAPEEKKPSNKGENGNK